MKPRAFSPEETTQAQKRCREKIAYNNWPEAEEAALLLTEDIRDGKLKLQKHGYILAYKCDFCEFWHIGHSTKHTVNRTLTGDGNKSGWIFNYNPIPIVKPYTSSQ